MLSRTASSAHSEAEPSLSHHYDAGAAMNNLSPTASAAAAFAAAASAAAASAAAASAAAACAAATPVDDLSRGAVTVGGGGVAGSIRNPLKYLFKAINVSDIARDTRKVLRRTPAVAAAAANSGANAGSSSSNNNGAGKGDATPVGGAVAPAVGETGAKNRSKSKGATAARTNAGKPPAQQQF